MKLAVRPNRTRGGDSLARVLDQFFETPFTQQLPEVFSGDMIPAVNIAEDDKAMTVALELPGMEEKDIHVEVLGNQLVVSGERRFDEEKKNKGYYRVEHQYGSFARTISLPMGLRTDAIEALYKKGILTLTIPRVEPKPTTKVKVKAEA